MPCRNPVVLGRMLATYDVFSNGRVILGVGSGWMEEEFKALQTADFGARGAVTDEYIDIFKKVSAGGTVSHKGEHYRFDPVQCYPESLQRPHPPVSTGGVSNRALRRVAEKGDGWIFVSPIPTTSRNVSINFPSFVGGTTARSTIFGSATSCSSRSGRLSPICAGTGKWGQGRSKRLPMTQSGCGPRIPVNDFSLSCIRYRRTEPPVRHLGG